MEQEKCVEEIVDEKIKELIANGINEENLENLYMLVDIKKDYQNIEYWKKKGETMRYGNYNEYGDYGEYGRRRRGRNGRYRGEDMIEDIREGYGGYNEGYGHDSMKSLDYMLKSIYQLMQNLEEEASEEEKQLIKKYKQKMGEQ